MNSTNQTHISTELTEKIKSTYFKSMIVFFISISLLFVAIFGLTFELIASIFLFSTISLVIKYLINDLVDVSLIEDYLIIRQSVGKNTIAPINKIRKYKTKHFLNFVYTSFEFNIDGSKKKVFFFSSMEQNEVFTKYRSGQSLNAA